MLVDKQNCKFIVEYLIRLFIENENILRVQGKIVNNPTASGTGGVGTPNTLENKNKLKSIDSASISKSSSSSSLKSHISHSNSSFSDSSAN